MVELEKYNDKIGVAFWKKQYEGYETAIQKNQDYGDSFREHGFMGVLVRLSDKVKRLVHISKGNKINFEAQEDTFKDLANYCVMGIFLLDENEDKANKNFKPDNKFQWTCNFCKSNKHDFYSNEKNKNGELFKVLTCPVVKDKQFYSYCNYCKQYGHCIYYKFAEKYKNDEDKKLYTCPKLIQKMKGKFQKKRTYDYENSINTYCSEVERAESIVSFTSNGSDYYLDYDDEDCGPW